MENKYKKIDGHVFKMAMATKSFIYFIGDSECDDNGSVRMYEKETGHLVSDNYMANRDMHQNLLYFNYEWICERLRYSRKCMVEECKINLAQEYYHENEIEHNGILGWSEFAKRKFNDALLTNLGFTLSKYDLREVRKQINPDKNKGLTM